MRFTPSKATERPQPQTVEERNAALATLEAEQHSARPASAYAAQQQRHNHHQQQQQQYSATNPYNQPGAAAADAPSLATPRAQGTRMVTRTGAGERADEQQNNSDDEEARTTQAARQAARREYGSEREYADALKRVRGYDIVPMGEDGACLFRAVAYHVYADQEMHSVVRANCLDYMVRIYHSYARCSYPVTGQEPGPLRGLHLRGLRRVHCPKARPSLLRQPHRDTRHGRALQPQHRDILLQHGAHQHVLGPGKHRRAHSC